MTEIKTFPFDKDKFDQLKEYHFGLNWPVVYIQEDGKEMYIGQTTSLYSRSRQHIENPSRARLKRIHVLTDDEFNMSAAFDFESLLIQYISAEGKFKLQNANGGLVNHNYFEREKYQAKLDSTWKELQKKGLVSGELRDIRNSEFFKYSPYKALTEDQLIAARTLERQVKKDEPGTYIVHGAAGTGKSVLALYLLKSLKENEETAHLNIALVVPMTGLRTTLQRVVRRVPGLGSSSVIGPSDVVKEKYDLLIVDEAHRLRRRVNLSNFGSFDTTNRNLKLPKEGTQLDWILASSKQQILFYDARQSVVPADVRAERFKTLKAKHYYLTSQLRVEGGEDYLEFVDDLFEFKTPRPFPSTYDFKMYNNVRELISAIKEKNSEHSLARVVAGYAWPWNTKGKRDGYDIEIDGLKLRWNSTNIDWVNSKDSLNEIGCIHTIQGYDLNYTGVIIGPEVSYDENSGGLVIDEKKYKDINGKRSITDPGELRQYILNIYKTLLTRGIKGTYVYVVDDKLRRRLEKLISSEKTKPVRQSVVSPITAEMIRIPLVGSAPCGNPLLGEENIEEYIAVPKIKLRPGYDYFILRAEGDSMNLAGIQDGDLVLCRQQLKADTGDRVVSLLGDNVTIKIYGPRENGIRLLLPKSTNTSHKPITPGEGDSVQGIVQEVIEP